MRGKEASTEELVDWRLCDHVTIRDTVSTPIGPVGFFQTAGADAQAINVDGPEPD